MPTKAEIKKLSKPIKVRVRKGDHVMIIAGKDKGNRGVVIAVSPKENKVLVVDDSNPDQPVALNAVIRHRKPKMQNEQGTRVTIPAPIHISNVMVIDDQGNPTRVGKKLVDGKLVRVSKKSGNAFDDKPIMESREKA